MTKQSNSNSGAIPFGQGLGELEQITAWFESDTIDLDDGVAKFERGLSLIAQLRSQLETVENRVEKIRADFALGGQGGELGLIEEPEPEVADAPPRRKAATGDVDAPVPDSPALFDL